MDITKSNHINDAKIIISGPIDDTEGVLTFKKNLYEQPCKRRQLPEFFQEQFSTSFDKNYQNKCITSASTHIHSSCTLKYFDGTGNCADFEKLNLSDDDTSDKEKLSARNICKQPSVGFYPLVDGKILCEYDLDLINNIYTAKSYIEKFGWENSKSSLDQIMRKVCFLPTTVNCPLNTETQKQHNFCPFIRANNDYGEMCRTWAEKTKDHQIMIYDKMVSWCEDNPMSDDCKCLNRQFNENFLSLKRKFSNVFDVCWFKPCSSGDFMRFGNSKQCDPLLCDSIKQFKEHRKTNKDYAAVEPPPDCFITQTPMFNFVVLFCSILIVLLISLKFWK